MPPPNRPPQYQGMPPQNLPPYGAQPPYPPHPGAYQAPQPPKKKHTGLKVFGGILAVIVLITILGNIGGSKSATDSASGSTSASSAPAVSKADVPATDSASDSTSASSAPAVPEMDVTAETMLTDLDNNALKAETTYKGKVVKVTGYVHNIDAQGKYFSVRGDNEFTIIGVQARITPEQKAQVAEFSMGEKVTFVGTVTSVGEVLGYSVKVSEINPAS